MEEIYSILKRPCVLYCTVLVKAQALTLLVQSIPLQRLSSGFLSAYRTAVRISQTSTSTAIFLPSKSIGYPDLPRTFFKLPRSRHVSYTPQAPTQSLTHSLIVSYIAFSHAHSTIKKTLANNRPRRNGPEFNIKWRTREILEYVSPPCVP